MMRYDMVWYAACIDEPMHICAERALGVVGGRHVCMYVRHLATYIHRLTFFFFFCFFFFFFCLFSFSVSFFFFLFFFFLFSTSLLARRFLSLFSSVAARD
ncbi:hypothetical protein IWX92DRAFT_176796 [Phyllosticta citricarpa]